MKVPSVTWPQVDAWRLARHRLSPRVGKSGFERIATDVGGIHAQVMSAADLQFAARVDGLHAADVHDALWERRSLVRTWAMRGTLHIFAAEDFPLIIAALRTRDHWRRAPWFNFVGLTPEGMEATLGAIAEALDGRSLTREELADAVEADMGPRVSKVLRSGWGELLKPAAYQGILCSGPNKGRNVAFVRPDQWVKGWRVLDPDESARAILRRFVHLHGPTRLDNFAHWWGWARASARRVWRSIEGDLEEVEVEGESAWVLGDDVAALRAARPDDSIRLLPNFDPYLLAYHPRSRFIADRFREHVFRQSGWISPVVLVGGRIVAVWELVQTKGGTDVIVEPFGRLPGGARKAIGAEAARIGEFLGVSPKVRFESVSYLQRASARAAAKTGSAAATP